MRTVLTGIFVGILCVAAFFGVSGLAYKLGYEYEASRIRSARRSVAVGGYVITSRTVNVVDGKEITWKDLPVPSPLQLVNVELEGNAITRIEWKTVPQHD